MIHPTRPGADDAPDLHDVPVLSATAASLDDAELLLTGACGALTGFLARAERDSVRGTGRLPGGEPWPVPVVLPVPAGVAQVAGERGLLVLEDEETTPVALVQVAEVWQDGDVTFVAGPISRLRPFERGPARELRREVESLRGTFAGHRVLGVPVTDALDRSTTAAIDRAASACGARFVLLLPCVGQGGDGPATAAMTPTGLTRAALSPAALIRATEAAAQDLEHEQVVVPVPLRGHGDSATDASMQVHVAVGYGATHVALPERADHPHRAVPPDERTEQVLVPLTVAASSCGPERWHPDVARELAAARRPAGRRGVTVLFTGLSGSGKSTVALGLYEHLLDRGERTVSLLDGDVVRQLLSSGLGFSRADRELNVARIGYVAAEVTRHGGMVLCAPIAPFAAGRDEMRRRVSAVGDFVLVHVSTPLQVCEARDRKGLYARARAGQLPEFTGVSSPYEKPTDADLVIDTSSTSVPKAVERVILLLQRRGHLTSTGGPLITKTGEL